LPDRVRRQDAHAVDGENLAVHEMRYRRAAGVTQVGADSPYYAGTIAFFGSMMSGMKMSHDATFAVPLPKRPAAFRTLALGAAQNARVEIRVVPSNGQGGPAPVLKSFSVGTP